MKKQAGGGLTMSIDARLAGHQWVLTPAKVLTMDTWQTSEVVIIAKVVISLFILAEGYKVTLVI